MIQPLFEHRMEFAGYRTRVLELEGSGPPILMFHGYADSADTWRLTLAQLARTGQRAVAVDLPGFGGADDLDSGLILPQLDAFALDALRYAGGRPRRPVVAVGNSLGGCLCLRLAAEHGSRIAGVLAAAPAGLQMSRLLFLVERDPVLRSLLALPAPVPGAVLRAAVARLYVQLAFGPGHSVDRRVISTFASHHSRRARVASYLAIAHRMLPELRGALPLEEVQAPCCSSGATTIGCSPTPAPSRSSTRCRVPGSSCSPELATAPRSRPPSASLSSCSSSWPTANRSPPRRPPADPGRGGCPLTRVATAAR